MGFVDMAVLVIGITSIVAVITLIINRKSILNINNDEDVINLLRGGDKLKAIKAYRQLHGVGLKEAKKFIDNCMI